MSFSLEKGKSYIVSCLRDLMSVPQKIVEMTHDHIGKAKDFVEGHQYMKVKKLSEGIGVPNNVAGCCFIAMEWKPVNPNSRNNKTYEDPNFKK